MSKLSFTLIFSTIAISLCLTGCFTRIAIPEGATGNTKSAQEMQVSTHPIIILQRPQIIVCRIPAHIIKEEQKSEPNRIETKQRSFIKRGANPNTVKKNIKLSGKRKPRQSNGTSSR